ncbi:MAG: sigma-54-dependent Fis family transcriptional regulator [Nitrospirae bacterium]|nr:MAG: sigma-54-dependent Fis family transcriptional regulator [Nitrospirota bacterium]
MYVLLVYEKGNNLWQDIKRYLRTKGIDIGETFTYQDALKAVKEGPFNLVLAEYGLNGMNPLVFLKRLKRTSPHVEIIFLSKEVPLSRAIEAMREGAYDFYEFPVNKRLLFTVMEKAAEKHSLMVEKMNLERKIKRGTGFEKVVGRSKKMQHVLEMVRTVAPKNVNVLITGETGTGKEMIANLIHYNSPRASGPFIKVNCAVFNEGVLESELFGHEKGAFTGAITRRIGRFELANGGTIFLDEIGDIPLGTQVKLLRVLQEKEFERVGGNETIKVDVRVIAATNHDLKKLIEEKRFREDLYYRLNVVHIELPPLRERKEDLSLLVSYFINKFNEEKGYGIKGITREAMQILMNSSWPGNVRELENAIESAMALSERNVIEAKYLPSFLLLSPVQNGDLYHIPQSLTLKEIEMEIIRLALEKTGGNRTKAAKMLGIGLRTLQRKIKQL